MSENSHASFSRELSQSRQMIYGFCALWLMLFHARVKIPSTGAWMLPSLFQRLGNCSVDIFLLLSAFGLYGSLTRNPDIGRFYVRRLQRVLLPSFIVMALYAGFTVEGTKPYMASMTFLPYWFGYETLWFVAFILTAYLVYPLLFRLQKRQPAALWVLFALSIVVAIWLGRGDRLKANALDLSVRRFPVFLLGCILAPKIHHSEASLGRLALLASLLVGALALAAVLLTHPEETQRYWILAICYIPISIAVLHLLMLLARVMLRLGPMGRFAYKCLAFCGGFSLECYLLFRRFNNILWKALPGGIALRSLRADWLAALCTLLAGFLLSRLCDAIIRAFGAVGLPGAGNEQPRR